MVGLTPPCGLTRSERCVPSQDSLSRLLRGLHNPGAHLVLRVRYLNVPSVNLVSVGQAIKNCTVCLLGRGIIGGTAVFLE